MMETHVISTLVRKQAGLPAALVGFNNQHQKQARAPSLTTALRLLHRVGLLYPPSAEPGEVVRSTGGGGPARQLCKS
jgi:hypothetical protein